MALVKVKGKVFFEAQRNRTVAAQIALLELIFVDFVVKSKSYTICESCSAIRITARFLR